MGSTSTSTTIQITDDTNNEGNETFKIIVFNIDGAVSSADLTTFEQVITITDDEMPTLSIDNSTFAVGENVAGGHFVLEFSLSGDTGTNVTFNYTLTDVSTTTGTDYTVPDVLTGTVSMGATTGQVMIPITNDEMNEGNEEFTLAITGLTGALFVDKSTTFSETITIVDDETPTISFAESSYEVVENVGGGMADIVVNLSNPSNRAIVIAYETIDDSAVSPGDFTGVTNASNTTKTIPIGMTSTTIQIPITIDSNNEGNEEFKVRISNLTSIGSGGSAMVTEVVVTIIDDEAPILTLTNSTFEVAENINGGNFVINYTLSGETTSNVTFNLSLTGDTATKGMDFSDPDQLMETIAIGDKTGMFMIPITDDSGNEGNEAFTLAITGITGAVASDKTDAFSQVITIIDDEDPKITFAQSTIEVGESRGLANLNVNISGATTNPVVITYETIDGTAASPRDFTGISSANPRNSNHWDRCNLD